MILNVFYFLKINFIFKMKKKKILVREDLINIAYDLCNKFIKNDSEC